MLLLALILAAIIAITAIDDTLPLHSFLITDGRYAITPIAD
jgi:hypothetical protein